MEKRLRWAPEQAKSPCQAPRYHNSSSCHCRLYKRRGSLTVGLPNTNAVTITAAQVTSQIQFTDYANIVFTVDTGTAPSNLLYPGAPFTFQQNAAIPTTSPVYSGGAIESCAASPTLPSGLSLSNTCAISGTPTATQDRKNYTVTATNAKGSTQTTISIIVSYRTDWSAIQSILQAQAALGRSGAETADTSTITGLTGGGGKWQGGVLAPNGKIYGIPANSSSVLIIDPTTNTADTSTITGLTGGWVGGVLAPNGKIYGIPQNSTSVLIIDPTTNTADTTTITGLTGTGLKWNGGVLAPNGKIYGIPRDSTKVLIIDPTTNTADTTTIAGLRGTIDKWVGGVLAPNGKIYGIPISITSVLIIDPTTNTANTTTITGLTGGGWAEGVLAPNGKIYGLSSTVLIIDPKCKYSQHNYDHWIACRWLGWRSSCAQQ
ncbi:MAG: putative Ig domain-containing protein [Leptospiraceae bacterium]|nr:putative Ig domain-containing protein [Leptospiraceae bacterium]